MFPQLLHFLYTVPFSRLSEQDDAVEGSDEYAVLSDVSYRGYAVHYTMGYNPGPCNQADMSGCIEARPEDLPQSGT